MFENTKKLGEFVSFTTDWSEQRWNSIWIGTKVYSSFMKSYKEKCNQLLWGDEGKLVEKLDNEDDTLHFGQSSIGNWNDKLFYGNPSILL